MLGTVQLARMAGVTACRTVRECGNVAVGEKAGSGAAHLEWPLL